MSSNPAYELQDMKHTYPPPRHPDTKPVAPQVLEPEETEPVDSVMSVWAWASASACVPFPFVLRGYFIC